LIRLARFHWAVTRSASTQPTAKTRIRHFA